MIRYQHQDSTKTAFRSRKLWSLVLLGAAWLFSPCIAAAKPKEKVIYSDTVNIILPPVSSNKEKDPVISYSEKNFIPAQNHTSPCTLHYIMNSSGQYIFPYCIKKDKQLVIAVAIGKKQLVTDRSKKMVYGLYAAYKSPPYNVLREKNFKETKTAIIGRRYAVVDSGCGFMLCIDAENLVDKKNSLHTQPVPTSKRGEILQYILPINQEAAFLLTNWKAYIIHFTSGKSKLIHLPTPNANIKYIRESVEKCSLELEKERSKAEKLMSSTEEFVQTIDSEMQRIKARVPEKTFDAMSQKVCPMLSYQREKLDRSYLKNGILIKKLQSALDELKKAQEHNISFWAAVDKVIQKVHDNDSCRYEIHNMALVSHDGFLFIRMDTTAFYALYGSYRLQKAFDISLIWPLTKKTNTGDYHLLKKEITDAQ